MRLKSLRLHGFKSFALRTEFTFPEGLTCIVGPNGCGKSNVVDAIKWVLGEQRPTALRGSEMQDVIFGGTAARKPVGMAEVTLVFDNANRTIDVDWTEVEVTRRVYRDGSSEYLLNRSRCRLRDLRELLMDTGSGQGAMTIMEQGKIDQILREGHQERRAVFEEAAGVAKYKARRKESLRRLEQVEADLLRVSDVVAEKQRLVRSLKIQAGRAERYQALVDEMRAKRLQLAVHRYGLLVTESDEATRRVEELTTAEAAARAEVERSAAECRRVEDEVEEARVSASRLEQEITSLEGQAETAREKSAFAARLMAELDGKIRWYRDEIESGGERLEQIAVAGQEVAESLARAAVERDERAAAVRAAEEGIRALAADHAERRRVTDGLARLAYEVVERRAVLGSRRSRLDARHQALEAQRARLLERLAGLESDALAARERAARTAEALSAAQARVDAAQSALAEAEARTAAAEERVRADRETATSLDREVSGLRSRVDVLQHLCRQMEGVAEGAKKLVAAARAGETELAGVRGLLAEFVETDAADAPLVESALGAYASAVVVATFADAERAAAYLARKRLGRCLLVPLDDIRAAAVGAGAESLAARVRCADDIRPVVAALLGETVAVATLAEARARRADAPHALRVVTVGGEVLESTGALAAGGEAGGTGVLRRRIELRDLSARLDEQRARLEAARASQRAAELEQTEARRALGAARDALRRDESDAHRARSESERTASDVTRLAGDSTRLDGEVEEIARELTRIDDEREVATADAARLDAERVDVEARRADAARAAADAEARLREAEGLRADLRVQAAAVQERCAALEARAKSLQTEIRDVEDGVREAREELAACEQRREEADQRGKQARTDHTRALARRDDCIVALTEVRHRLGDARARLEERRVLLDGFEKEAGGLGKELTRFRLRQNEARLRVENLVERLRDELEIDLHAAWMASRSEGAQAPAAPVYAESASAPFDAVAVEAEVQDLRDRIARMGNVNLEALDQLQTVEREADELQRQHDDLTRSRESLLEAIRRIDAESRELFVSTFEKIRENFRETFRRLFEGGKADIFLDEGQDVLEAGIDIVARPPGKEPRSISLLSGGERTMTAVALLFAIYKAKPSPFCLLDEVDAALDEANVERFATLVHEYSTESQFIIITHNKRTMSAADTIFGVSMPERGVSRRLAVRLEDVGDNGEIRAA
mgnify:CR=1 FL=1